MTNVAHTLSLKIKRANEHIDQLKALLGIGPNAIGPPRTQGILWSEDGLHYETDAPVPGADCGIIVGETLHQFRSTLDHLVCCLVRRRHAASVCGERRLQFPIAKSEADFRSLSLISQGTLKQLIGEDELTVIADAQPFARAPEHPTSHPLYVLGQLDNIDKHRVVLVFDQRVHVSGFVESAQGLTPFDASHQSVAPGTQKLDIGVSVPVQSAQVDRMENFIVFTDTEGICDGAPVFPLLRSIEREVNRIIKDSLPFFF